MNLQLFRKAIRLMGLWCFDLGGILIVRRPSAALLTAAEQSVKACNRTDVTMFLVNIYDVICLIFSNISVCNKSLINLNILLLFRYMIVFFPSLWLF